MSGSQHNPNGRQSQLGSGWSPLQLQMANLLARAPQAHMASDRGVTWHTPTPPPHLYHVPAPSPPDPLQMDAMLQAMKTGSNSVFRHTATPPDLYRHTPTPPDKHLMRHTPSPGDVKAGTAIPPVDLYPHLGPARDKLVRAEELLAYARVGVDLSLGSRANGATPPASAHPASHPAPHPASPALSVRDAPTINSLIARAAPRRVDSLLERLVPSPASPAAPSPHSVIVHSRVAPTPSPPSSNEDSVDSISAGGSKRKRKPERTVRVGARCSPAPAPAPPLLPALAVENGDTLPLHNGPDKPPDPAPHPASHVAPPPDPAPAPAPYDPAPPVAAATAPPSPRPNDTVNSTRRKTRSGSAETIADIAAMIAAGGAAGPVPPLAAPPLADKLETVLASPDPADPSPQPPPAVVAPEKDDDRLSETQSTSTGETTTAATSAAAPRRAPAPAATATAPVESPSEAAAPAPVAPPAPPAPQASFVEVENQLEKMFAALDDGSTAATAGAASTAGTSAPPPKRRKSAPARPRKGPRKKADAKPRHKEKELTTAKDAYDSGSNASSGRSRGPYIQIRGPRESPVSVTVMNAATGEEEESARGGSRRGRAGAGERRTGLHASTLGLRYDACTRDATWLCAFCGRGPHSDALGDLFGPYPVDTDHDEYRALDEVARRAHTAPAPAAGCEVWVHADCAVWAPGVVARGARVWGLARAVWAAAAARCRHCARTPASIACAARACSMRAHLPCARAHSWRLDEADFRAVCPAHANSV